MESTPWDWEVVMINVKPHLHVFTEASEPSPFTYQAEQPFRLAGLLLWGIREDTIVQSIRTGNIEQLVAPCSGTMFLNGYSVRQLKEAIEKRADYTFRRMAKMELVFPTINTGEGLRVEIEGSYTAVAVWGMVQA